MGLFSREPDKDPLQVVIIGAGEVGFNIAQRLSRENKQVTLVDQSADALEQAAEHLDVRTIHGSGSSPAVLDQADVESADIFLAVTDSDEANIIACIFAGALAPKAVKVARIRNEEYMLYKDVLPKEILDVGMVINPEVEVVKTIDRLMSVPGAVDYGEFADGKVKMVGVRVGTCPLMDVQLFNWRDAIGIQDVLIGAIVREERLIIPSGHDVIKEGDLVYFVCEKRHMKTVLRAFGRSTEPVENVMIIGGGTIGLRLATLFEQRGYHTRLVDHDEKRCEVLAEKLNKTVVLHGEATDQDFLMEENVDDMDVVVSLTSDEETNVLTSLLAKRLGARKTITRINKFAYLPLVRAIGIEHSVSPRLSTLNSILHFVRRGKVLSSVSIKGEEGEVMEAIAQEGSSLVGKPLMKLNFTKSAIILCLVRGSDVIIPSGDTVIEPLDRIILLSTIQGVESVEQALLGTLERL